MAVRDPEGFLDRTKLDLLTMAVGNISHAAERLKIDAGTVIKDGCILAPAEKLDRKARLERWRALYPVRELVHAVTRQLRATADRLDAEWERTEDSLCGLSDGRRRHG